MNPHAIAKEPKQCCWQTYSSCFKVATAEFPYDIALGVPPNSAKNFIYDRLWVFLWKLIPIVFTKKETSHVDSVSQDLTFLRLLCSADILSWADSRVRMLAIQKREFQPCLDSCNPSTCLPTGNPSVSVRIAFAELEHTHTHTDIADCHSRHESSRSGGQFKFVSIVCLDIGSRSCQPETVGICPV